MLAKELAELDQKPISKQRIKKVYIGFKDKDYLIEFDKKTLDEYGDRVTDGTMGGQIISRLDAPLLSKAGLPDERTGNNQSPIYPVIKGAIIKNSKELVFKHDEKQKNKTYKLNKAYLLEGDPLYKSYEKNKIIDAGCNVPDKLVSKVITEFNSKYKNIAKDLELKKLLLTFYLLPINAKENEIEYKSTKEQYSNNKSTKESNAKFISVNDPAFSLNLQQSMQNLKKMTGLTDEVFKKIILNPNHSINGLYWQFFETGTRNKDLLENIKIVGILKLFKELDSKLKDDYETQGALKIICFQQDRQTPQKITILISENMSFPRFRKIAGKINSLIQQNNAIRDYLLEDAFITIKGEKKDYSFYIDIIKTIIYESKCSRLRLINFFMWRLGSDRAINLHDAIDTKNYIGIYKYFQNNDYCIRFLCDDAVMDEEQKFAFGVGKVAGRYIRFKRENGEDNNSLNGILQYSKYDASRLRFVFTQISQGLGLSKIEEDKKQQMYTFIKSLLPNFPDSAKNEEISMQNDLAYFFYKGAFEELGGEK